MKKNVYVKLLEEGTVVYRTVLSEKFGSKENVFKLGMPLDYDQEDEIWEFSPNTLVIVEEKIVDNEKILLAIGEYDNR